jgi:glutamyl-tRNA(Gln) amidotransferase subunit D
MKSGEHISFSYKGNELKGSILSSEKGKVEMKLTSGYNMTAKETELKNVKALKVTAKQVIKQASEKKANTLPAIEILHTGGTVASKVDYTTGAVVAKYTAEELLGLYPELNSIANVSSTLIRNMMSDDMRFGHYNIMGEAVITSVKKKVAGIIITHGTDTLHYTAAALGFMLENLPIPVVLVGSQRSSDRGSSDAASNLMAASRFILSQPPGGVYTCLHEGSSDTSFLVIDGFHSRKMHSSRRDAFRPINVEPFARIIGEKVEILGSKELANGKLALHPFNEKVNVGILMIHPNMKAAEFEAYKGYDGLVLLGTGLGHAPVTEVDELCKEHVKILEKISELAAKMPVAMSLQTIYGRVNMNVYSPGRKLLELGVLGQNTDMTPETAFIKLAWLLSTYKKDVKKLYNQNLRGEMTERSEEKGFSKP